MTQELDLSSFQSFLLRALDRTAAHIVPLFANPDCQVDVKSDSTPVTKADRGAESILRELIHTEFPSHGIIGEEFGRENDQAEFVWTLDPVDGTKAFVSGVPLFTTLVSLLYQGHPVLGVIHQPLIKQLCIGDGRTTRLNGRIVRVRETADLSQATVLATSVNSVERYWPQIGFEKLTKQAKLFRTWGDGYGYMLVACGYADVMLDPVMNLWDIMPLIPIIEGAGGKISTWDGKNAVAAQSAVATNGVLHQKVLDTLMASS